MNTLDQRFVDNQILPADQLNSIVSKLNEVIRAYNSLDPGVSSETFASAISNLTQRINSLSQSSATKQELQSAITEATQEFERQLQALGGQVDQQLQGIKGDLNKVVSLLNLEVTIEAPECVFANVLEHPSIQVRTNSISDIKIMKGSTVLIEQQATNNVSVVDDVQAQSNSEIDYTVVVSKGDYDCVKSFFIRAVDHIYVGKKDSTSAMAEPLINPFNTYLLDVSGEPSNIDLELDIPVYMEQFVGVSVNGLLKPVTSENVIIDDKVYRKYIILNVHPGIYTILPVRDVNVISPTTQFLYDSNKEKTQAELNVDLQAQIDDIVAGQANLSLTATPSVLFVGQATNTLIKATSDTDAQIKVTLNDEVIGEGASPLNLNQSVTLEDGETIINAEFIIRSIKKYRQTSLYGVYPIKYGAGQSYSEAAEQASPKRTPVGTYNITVAQAGDYVFFVVPASMSINSATMSGFDFPLLAPESVTIDGVAYKSYQSANTYDAGSLQIILQ